MAENPGGSPLQSLLQTAVQSAQWTYSLFWKPCPQKGMLVWSDGYYNGAIKTRKTVQGTEVSAEEASLHRSQQIKDLYESLSATAEESSCGVQQPTRRPTAALSPEDLTESEWFYLMCISFSFPLAVGLPGKAYAKRQHIWLTGANEVESKVFSRAILAKSARIQTVVCIPVMDGVVELGTTERVKEDYEFVQHIKNHFMEPQRQNPKPALSEHSSSEPPSQQINSSPITAASGHHHRHGAAEEGDEEEEEEEDEEEEDEAAELESDADVSPKNQTADHFMAEAEAANPEIINVVMNNVAASELMQFDMSESIRLGTPDDASTDLDSDFHLLRQMPQHPSFLPHQGAPMLEEFSREDTHYSETISSIIRHRCGQWSEFSTTMAEDYVVHTAGSAFSRWNAATSSARSSHHNGDRSSQWVLKYTLFTVPFLHAKNSHGGVANNPPSKLCKGAAQEEPNASHVLAERRRREKLNERFIILRSLIPFVTKMGKASILGDTIEYVKQLRKRIQELEEARGSQSEVDRQSIGGGVTQHNPTQRSGASKPHHQMGPRLINKRAGTRTAERGGGGTANDTEEDAAFHVEVSIIESDALVELRCPYRESLILDVMQMLKELGLETTTVQSSVNGGIFCAEFRAKVKENSRGRKATIVEVKKAIHSIIPQF
uniref:Putative anthocyanin transcriptional regulator n=1 Tax=Operculina pteripes TaxID=197425 RepID=A9YF31_9ASTE|nr:putative anthocyanin transcriptional regulator [Operculina pteripes]